MALEFVISLRLKHSRKIAGFVGAERETRTMDIMVLRIEGGNCNSRALRRLPWAVSKNGTVST
jgi:hypothetical protein